MTKAAESATQRAYDFIRQRLQNREVQPGARLVTRNLAKELGTSLNPVREALNRLSSQGLVEHVPGAGTFVHQPDPRSIRELYGLREAIEGFAVTEAIEHISQAELATLKKLCADWGAQAARMREHAIEQLDGPEHNVWAAQEEHFHRTLIDAAGNQLLSRIVHDQGVLARMFACLIDFEYVVTVATIEQVAATHTALVESIEARNADAARAQISAMLRHGRDCVLGEQADLLD